ASMLRSRPAAAAPLDATRMLKWPLPNLYNESAFEPKHSTIRYFACWIENQVPGRDGPDGRLDRGDFDTSGRGFARGKQSGDPHKCGTNSLVVSGAGRSRTSGPDSRDGNLLRTREAFVRAGWNRWYLRLLHRRAPGITRGTVRRGDGGGPSGGVQPHHRFP